MDKRNGLGLLLLLSIPYGVLSYMSTRGPDGDVFPNIYFMLGLGLFYSVMLWRSGRPSFLWLFAHLAAFLAATVIPFGIPPYLEEMGGMAYAILPGVVLLNSIAAALAARVVKPFLQHGA